MSSSWHTKLNHGDKDYACCWPLVCLGMKRSIKRWVCEADNSLDNFSMTRIPDSGKEKLPAST